MDRQPAQSQNGAYPSGYDQQQTDGGSMSGLRPPRGDGAYPASLTPAVRPGDVVLLLPQNTYHRVTRFSPQPGVLAFETDDGDDLTVGANSVSDPYELTELHQDPDTLGQVRLVAPGQDIDDGLEITVDYGGSQAPYYTTKNERGIIDNETGTIYGYDSNAGNEFVADALGSNLLEYYIWEDAELYFTVENTTAGSLTLNDVRFAGYEFKTEKITPDQIDVQPIPIPTGRIED